jgi:hypothetical protein
MPTVEALCLAEPVGAASRCSAVEMVGVVDRLGHRQRPARPRPLVCGRYGLTAGCSTGTGPFRMPVMP